MMLLIIDEITRYSESVNEIISRKMEQAECQNKTFDDSKLHEEVYIGVIDHQE